MLGHRPPIRHHSCHQLWLDRRMLRWFKTATFPAAPAPTRKPVSNLAGAEAVAPATRLRPRTSKRCCRLTARRSMRTCSADGSPTCGSSRTSASPSTRSCAGWRSAASSPAWCTERAQSANEEFAAGITTGHPACSLPQKAPSYGTRGFSYLC
jgi:hypothetical protein